jgi:hypothetical protein
VSETPVAGYNGAFSGACDSNGNVTVSSSTPATCTLTNTFQTGPVATTTLTVIKDVINDDNGTSIDSDFTINVTGAATTSFAGSASGTEVVFTSYGNYSVTENFASGYTVSYSADCSGTIAPGNTKTCTVTNDDIATSTATGTLILIKNVLGEDGVTDISDTTSFTVNVQVFLSLRDLTQSSRESPKVRTLSQKTQQSDIISYRSARRP